MFVFGWRTLTLKQFNISRIDCPICKTKGSITFSLLCRIYHFFFIPLFPDTRYIHAACEHCGESIGKVDMEKGDREIFNVKKHPERAPKYAWLGTILFAFTVLYFVVR